MRVNCCANCVHTHLHMTYFDNASTTWPKPNLPIDTGLINAGRGQYKAAAKSGAVIANTREAIKELLCCNALYETVFTSSAAEALNTILQGMDYSNIKTVYITPFEHNAVNRTIFHLQNLHKYGIIKLCVTQQPLSYDLDGIAKRRKTYEVLPSGNNKNKTRISQVFRT